MTDGRGDVTKTTLEALRQMIGTEVGLSDWIMVDQTMIDGFADVTDDHQFIHIDPERAAAETAFGGTIAHGFLTLSLLSRMIDSAVPEIDGVTMGINYGFDKIRFLAPVPVGSSIRGRFLLIDIDERNPGEVTSTYQVEVGIQGHEKPALAATWLTRIYVADNPKRMSG